VAQLAAKQAAASAEARFQAIAQVAQEGIVIYGCDRIIRFANAAMERMHGYAPGSLQGLPMETLMPEDVKKVFLEDMAAHLRSQKGDVIGGGVREFEGKRRDGRHFPVEISVSELKEGKETLFVAVQRDISGRKNAEHEIQGRTTRLNAVLANSPFGMVVLDKNHLVQICNPAFEELFQYRSAEIVGLNIDSLVAPQEMLEEASSMSKRGMQGQVVHAITRRRRKDGSLVDVEIHGVPLMIDGQLDGTYAIYQDITERKKLKLYEQLLPVCCVCGKIRDDQGVATGQGAWDRLDHYISKHSDAKLSHTFCPACLVQYRKEQGIE
jgi:PAS domain S-box-containing protein